MSELGLADPFSTEPLGPEYGDSVPPPLYEALPETPEFYVALCGLKTVGPIEKTPVAHRQHYRAYFDDGSTRPLALTTPASGVSRDAIWNVHNGAWFTSLDGHNAIEDTHFADYNMATVTVGASGEVLSPEIIKSIAEVASHPIQFARAVRRIRVEHSAALMHGLLDALPHYGNKVPAIQTEVVALVGQSHGSHTALAATEQAAGHGRKVATAQIIAPVYLNPVSSFKAGRTIVAQTPDEIRAFYRLLQSLPADQRRKYRRTVKLNPLTGLHTLATWPTIRSGQPGRSIRNIPTDQDMDVTLHIGDLSGQSAEYAQEFANRPNVHVHLRDGAHMSLADPELRDLTTGRLLEARAKAALAA